MLEVLFRVEASNFAAGVFVAGQFVHSVDTTMSFYLPVINSTFLFLKVPKTTEDF